MSYSRWSNSRWYTYYCAGHTDRDNALLDVCMVATFSAKRLRGDIDACINKVATVEPNATEDDLQELKGYMLEFLADVDLDYPVTFAGHLRKHITTIRDWILIKRLRFQWYIRETRGWGRHA